MALAVAAGAVETDAVARLPGGDLRYVLRRSPRSHRLRVTIQPERGVVVVDPPRGRRGWARPEPIVRRSSRSASRGSAATSSARRPRARGSMRGRRSTTGAWCRTSAWRTGCASSRRRPACGPRASRVWAPTTATSSLVERVARDRRPTAAILEAWFRARARAALDAAIARHGPPLGVAPARITLRDTTSRWGSCSRKGNLSFSWRLVLAPPEALDAVAAHELCHLRVFGHGPRFIALLASRVPDHAAWRRWLRKHSAELHAAID